MQELHTKVDHFLESILIPENDLYQNILDFSHESGLPEISISPSQGKFLQLLVYATGAKNILEIGTLGGYSAIWMAKGLPKEGKLFTCEFDPKHVEVAKINVKRAECDLKIEILPGDAKASLNKLLEKKVTPFDLIFIDADKESYPTYLELSLKLSRTGTLIIGDNMIRKGQIIDDESSDLRVQQTRNFLKMIGSDQRLLGSTAIQTVGSKGYDGFSLSIVK